MVTHQAVEKFAFAEPFKPFRIRLTNGRTLDVYENDSLFLGVSRLTMFPPLDPESSAAMDHFPFDAIESLTLLETSAV
jgi:hypothetical protein